MSFPIRHNSDTLPAHERTFDGVICFGGEDWWYHNRGHYDMQLMQRFAASAPVLYVNSIGMRVPQPTEGRMFLRRIKRKLRSVLRGTVQIDHRFAVTSPLHLPSRVAQPLTQYLLPWQIMRAARARGMKRPLLWIACPPAAACVEALQRAGAVGMVYQRTDRTECFYSVDHAYIRACDRWLKSRADVTLFCSTLLLEEEAQQCLQPCYVDHGVDADMFIAAGKHTPHDIAPADLAALPRPRIGFVGGIDAHTFDPNLLCEVARRMPAAHFALTGSCSLPRDWCTQPNVRMLGQKPYQQVPAYMAGCDVLIMPWNQSRWINACNPIKLKEYLAVGRPIVTTPFAEAQRYAEHLHIATGPEQFTAAIARALEQQTDVQPGRQRVQHHTWEHKAHAILDRLGKLGVQPASSATLHAPTDTHARRSQRRVPTHARRPIVPVNTQHRTTHALSVDRTIEPKPRVVQNAAVWCDAKLAGIIMLAGGLQPSELVQQSGQHVLDLWIAEDATVLDVWLERLSALRLRWHSLVPLRIVTSATMPIPWQRSDMPAVYIEQERQLFRGPAGVVRDCCDTYAADEHVLVVEAGRAPLGDIDSLWNAHARSGVDVTIAAHADESPTGVMVARVAALQSAPPVGFVDMREQWLPRLHNRGFITATHTMNGWFRPLRTGHELLGAARALCLQEAGNGRTARGARELSAGGEMRIICPGSAVHSSAAVIESLIMPGACVEAGATVVRSVVCSGCVVQAGTDIADAVASMANRVVAPARKQNVRVRRQQQMQGQWID